jgi:hypothetical protein
LLYMFWFRKENGHKIWEKKDIITHGLIFGCSLLTRQICNIWASKGVGFRVSRLN